MRFSRTELERAVDLVGTQVPQSPQHAGPSLVRRLGAEVWLKHGNHTPMASFQLRGAVTFMDWLTRTIRRRPVSSRRRAAITASASPARRARPACARWFACRKATRWRRTPRCAPSGRSLSSSKTISTALASRPTASRKPRGCSSCPLPRRAGAGYRGLCAGIVRRGTARRAHAGARGIGGGTVSGPSCAAATSTPTGSCR